MEFLKAFIIGGCFCLIGQILIDKTKLTPARILVSYVVVGVFLSGIGFYEYLAEFAGAGATVPLTGFGHAIARGVREAIQEQGLTLTLAEQRKNGGQMKQMTPSRFLDELPQDELDWLGRKKKLAENVDPKQQAQQYLQNLKALLKR
jgi:stage V sporulation protein AE